MIEIIGVSNWATDLRKSIDQVSGYRSSVLVTGPSGTGKELVARSIHQQSPRSDRPFIVVDCTAIPPSLFASQLFGHVKGSFSGAEASTLGMFRAADGGTVFLDEIGELGHDLQAQLLRVIQQRTVTPVGSHECIPVDLRIVAATNRDLATEVKEGRFRLDLYYRLNVVKVLTLALRDRPEDIPILCQHILDVLSVDNGMPHKRIAPQAMRILQAYQWPGNVRELQNALERVVVFTTSDEIAAEHLMDLLDPDLYPEATESSSDGAACPAPAEIPDRPVAVGEGAVERHGVDGIAPAAPQAFHPETSSSWPSLAENEQRLIEATLQRTGYNQRVAAQLLKVDRRLLARKIRKYEIDMPNRPRTVNP